MLPPSIPTSFVPHSSSAPASRFRAQASGIFGPFAYGVLGLTLIMALGVFLYGHLTLSEKAVKDTELAKAEERIDQATVENFVRLRNRVANSERLLNDHVAFSNFFTILSTLVPANIRFSSLHITRGSESVEIEGIGVAKNFNALAAVSSAFAADGRIKNAIFSHIVVDREKNTVAFAVSATLDPKLVAFTASPKPSSKAPAAATTTSSL